MAKTAAFVILSQIAALTAESCKKRIQVRIFGEK